MAPISTSFSALLLLGTSLALPRDEAELQKRGAVDDCNAVLVALKASSFCSSFVPITDITTTTTKTAPTCTTTVSVNAPPCTITAAPTTTTSKLPLSSCPRLLDALTRSSYHHCRQRNNYVDHCDRDRDGLRTGEENR